jgi:hypothetical protein
VLTAPTNEIDELLEIEFRKRPPPVDVLVADRNLTISLEFDFALPVSNVLRKLLARSDVNGVRSQQCVLFVAPRSDPDKTELLDANGTLGSQLKANEILVLKRPKTGVVNKLLGTVRRSAAMDEPDVGDSSTSSTTSTTAGDADDSQLPVFGVPLEALVRRVGGLPAIVRHSVAFIEKYGLDQEGIYRLSGSAARIDEMKARIDRGQELRFEPTSNVHDATGVLKRFLRELPEGVLTERLYLYFLTAARCEQSASRVHFLRAVLRAMPRAHAMLTEFILRHLARVVAHQVCWNRARVLVSEREQETNKMHANNVATVFGPLLLRGSTEQRQLAHTGIVNETTKELVRACVLCCVMRLTDARTG